MGLLLPIVYNQQDGRWANNLLGFNTNQPFNFYNYACLITCLAMIAKYYGKDWDVVRINDDLKKMGAGKGFVAGGGDYVWGGFHLLFGDIEEKLTRTPDELTNAQMSEIKNAIDAGYPVMVQLDVNPKTVALETHYVLLIAYNPNDENDFTIADPIGGRIHSLKDYLGWFRPKARNTIWQYAIYKGNVPTTTPQCLVPNTKEWRDTYENLVRNSSEYEKVVHEYVGSDADPKTTTFEQIRSVISGIKSRVTDLTNKLNEKDIELAKANTEITNKDDQIANVQRECQRQLDIEKARYKELNDSLSDGGKMETYYKGQISDLQGKLRDSEKAGGQKDIQIAELKTKLEQAQKPGNTTPPIVVDKNLIQALLDFIQGLLKK